MAAKADRRPRLKTMRYRDVIGQKEDWTIGHLDSWTIGLFFGTNFLDHPLDPLFLYHFIGGRQTISTQGGVG